MNMLIEVKMVKNDAYYITCNVKIVRFTKKAFSDTVNIDRKMATVDTTSQSCPHQEVVSTLARADQIWQRICFNPVLTRKLCPLTIMLTKRTTPKVSILSSPGSCVHSGNAVEFAKRLCFNPVLTRKLCPPPLQ